MHLVLLLPIIIIMMMEIVTVSMPVIMTMSMRVPVVAASMRRPSTGRQTNSIVISMRIRLPTRHVTPAIRFAFHAVLVLHLVIVVIVFVVVRIRLIVAVQTGRGAGGRGGDVRGDCGRGLGLNRVVAVGERVARGCGGGLLLELLQLLAKLVLLLVLLMVRCLSGVI